MSKVTVFDCNRI